jgi:hypothetical protein
LGIRAPFFLAQESPISIPTSVSSLFPICLTTGSVMPASETALVVSQKPLSISLCSNPPCNSKVAAAVTATAGSIPDKAQVLPCT